MNTKSPQWTPGRPWVFGSYAVYAKDPYIARRVYEHARSQADPSPFGTIELDTGERFDWININYRARRRWQND